MSITQTFYDNLASQYDKLFLDWDATIREQAAFLEKLFQDHGYGRNARILDCACGIGTQAIGLAELGYPVTGSDLSEGALDQARIRAAKHGVEIPFARADFCALEETFSEQFDIVIAMDNALPHMLTEESLAAAIESIINQIAPGGMFVASIRDYDAILMNKPPYSPPYIHQTPDGQRVAFQTWQWEGENYRLVQYIIEDGKTLQTGKFECEYRATRREELTKLLEANGCSKVAWLLPAESGFYQPIVIGKKDIV